MAEISFRLYTSDKMLIPGELLSWEIRRDISAPCDSVSLRFKCEAGQDELERAEAYADGRLIFSGFCDLQREEKKGEHCECFVYARSAACLLVDNEAEPYTYESPTARALFNINAEKYGFSFCMEDVGCSGRYVVNKGRSAYSAINGLVEAVSGKRVTVTPELELRAGGDGRRLTVSPESILRDRKSVCRGSAISRIDYKTADGSAYSHHIKSRSLERKGISKSRKVNLSSLYEWQQALELKNMLKSAAQEYFSRELTLEGTQDIQLYDRLLVDGEIGGEDYYVCSACSVFDRRGERTVVRLTRDIDLEEIIYVD